MSEASGNSHAVPKSSSLSRWMPLRFVFAEYRVSQVAKML